jgi:hypothetical protein
MSGRASSSRCARSFLMASAANQSRGNILVRASTDSCAGPGCTDTDARRHSLLPSFGDNNGRSSIDDGLSLRLVLCADDLLSQMWMRSGGALVSAGRETPQRIRRYARQASRPATPRSVKWLHRTPLGGATQKARQPKLMLAPTNLAIEAVAQASFRTKASDRFDPGHGRCRSVPRGTDRTRSVCYRRTSRSVFRMIVAGPIQVDRSVVVSFPQFAS